MGYTRTDEKTGHQWEPVGFSIGAATPGTVAAMPLEGIGEAEATDRDSRGAGDGCAMACMRRSRPLVPNDRF